MKRGKGFAASQPQREKVAELPCVYCGMEGVDPAHLWPRSAGGCDHEDCVIPLCREHHRSFDTHGLELLPRLVDKGYYQEMGHAIAVHEVSPAQLVTRVTLEASLSDRGREENKQGAVASEIGEP